MQTSNLKPLDNAAQYGWACVGWFGTVAGASTWMLCTGVFLIANGDTFAGMIPVASGLITLATGVVLWKLRDRLSINNAMIVLLAVTLVTVSIAIACTVWIASPDMLARLRWPTNPIPMIAFLTLILGAGIWTNYSQATRQDKFETRDNKTLDRSR